MRESSNSRDWPTDNVWRELVEFLRRWLPDEAVRTYRAMIDADPERWYLDAHFSGGVIVNHALRGNGIDERALGIRDLDAIWPAILEAAVRIEPDQSRHNSDDTNVAD